METTIKLGNIRLPMLLERATVIHVNKFSVAQGGAFNFPVFSTLYTDVVFRLTGSNKDIKTYIKNLDLPIYNEQDVTVIFLANKALGYIDMQTNTIITR